MINYRISYFIRDMSITDLSVLLDKICKVRMFGIPDEYKISNDWYYREKAVKYFLYKKINDLFQTNDTQQEIVEERENHDCTESCVGFCTNL